jgi:TonB family protein
MTTLVETEPKLLLQLDDQEGSRRALPAVIGSILVHIALFVFFTLLAHSGANPPNLNPESAANLTHKATRLVDPPMELTQRAPNRAKVAKEVMLEELTPQPAKIARVPTPPAPAARTFQPPQPESASPPQAKALPEPPKTEASARPPQAGPPGIPAEGPAAPQIQPQEKPKLAFETPGGQSGAAPQGGATLGKMAPPKNSVDEAIRSLAHGGAQGGIVVGDPEEAPSIPNPLRQSPAPPSARSQLELLSDPMGVDFKPYLIRILATVRRNWFAVIPESARMGRRGKVLLQFSIDRSGQVPKLVIAMPSGADALDRAAVAGISASAPFPPLPKEFKGNQIRLQFAFSYNMGK